MPAIEDMCNAWASCMNRDVVVAQYVSLFDFILVLVTNMCLRAKVSAETIAEIINSFVEPISYKTLV